MNNCLLNSIGIKTACGVTDSTSGLYINEFAGITSEMLDYIKKPEMRDYFDSWAAVQNNAFYRLSADFRYMLKDRFVIKQHNAQYKAIQQNESGYNLPPEITKRGFAIQLPFNDGAEYELTNITIQSNETNTTVNTDINIYNMNTGLLLATTTFPLAPGFKSYNVFIKFSLPHAINNRIFVCIDTENLLLNSKTVNFHDTFNFGNCAGCGVYNIQSGYIPMASPVNNAGLITDGYSPFGFTLNANCTFDSVICEYRSSLIDSWRLILALEILDHFFVNDKYSQLLATRGKALELLANKWISDYKANLLLATSEINLCDNDCFQRVITQNFIWN